MTRAIGVITSTRADFGHLKPLLRALAGDPAFAPALYVTGSHLAAGFGHTVDEIRAEGFAITAEVPLPLEDDTPAGSARALAAATRAFGALFAAAAPDLVCVYGDRFEMLGAGLAAVIGGVPVAHIAGGDLTEGALDDAYRHALTKLSHLHFPSTEESARRILQMGEEPWRVRAVGELSLDNLLATEWLDERALAERLGLAEWAPPLLVTYHPVTLELADTGRQVESLVAALAGVDGPIVITAANHDAGGRSINARLRTFAATRPDVRFVESLGWRAYASLMRRARAMVGNSSSGIVEAPSFGLPVVNIGTRQEGRLRAQNVIDTGYDTEAIRAALARALAPEFRESLRGLRNPYGDGKAAPRIVEALRARPPRDRLLRKVFQEL